jgi:cytochrome c-type biogenesis protein CcmH
MFLFWLLAALMVALALAFVIFPLLRTRADAGPSAKEANLEVLRGQRQEIEADVVRGVLPADARDDALADLMSRADADLAAEPVRQHTAPRRPWIAAVALAVLVPALSFAVYLATGSPHATDPKNLVARPEVPQADPQIVAMVESLAMKVRERPDDVQGWSLLARSMAALARYDEAAKAYEHVARLSPRDPQVLADYADALGMAQGRRLSGKPYELVKAALAVDPKHRKSLALAGTAAMEAKDFAAAQKYWMTLASNLPPGSEDEAQVRAILEEVRMRASAAGQALPPVALAEAPSAAVPAAGKTVAGSITVAPEIAARVSQGDTLFVFARPEDGSRVPLAVLRASARQLPLAFTLDDSMAMSPQSKLSQAASVRIEARITRSGNATPQPGDLVGRSDPVRPGARDVKIVVNEVLP